jgi:hypothetical protein
MTTDAVKVSVLNTLTNLQKSFDTFKDRYCPDGNTCENIAVLGSLTFVFWFMYLAMAPII